MKRTQLYLSEKTLEILKKEAVETKQTVSEIVRESVDTRLKQRRGNGASFLVKLALQAEKEGIKGPSDLSTNHDDYLYGRKSPKWAYLYKQPRKKKK